MSDEAKKVDPAKRAALLDFWIKKWTKDKQIVVFSSTDEAMDACLPTIVTMSELARRVTGCEIKHYGMGVFGAKSYTGQEIFSFCGGGAMDHDSAIDCCYSILGMSGNHTKLVLKLMREIAPGGWDEIKRRKEARKAERVKAQEAREAAAFEASQNLSAKEATDLWNKAGEYDEAMDKAQRELLKAARAASRHYGIVDDDFLRRMARLGLSVLAVDKARRMMKS